MNRMIRIAAVTALVGGALTAASVGVAADSGGARVLEADALVGVSGPFLGAANAVRGVNGGGAPWVIDDAEVDLRVSGRLDVEVEGLVIDPAFPNPAVAGRNPAATFLAIVSCLTTDGSAVVTTNVSTAPFAATPEGDAEFHGSVRLPSPCVAPIVFVSNGANGAWFAATGV